MVSIMTPFSHGERTKNPRTNAARAVECAVQRSVQDLRGPLRESPPIRLQSRDRQDTEARRPPSEHSERSRQGQGVPSSATPRSDRQTEGEEAMTQDHFTYRVTWSPEDGEHVGLCAEFPSLPWLDATPEGALVGIRRVVADVVRDMVANGEK